MIDPVELAELADRVLAISGENLKTLAEVLDTLDAEARKELLASDLLNALQSFYYYFREMPSLLGEERLMLQPASEALRGIPFEDEKDLQLLFRAEEEGPVIEVTEAGEPVIRFEGPSAYRGARRYLEE
jgi:phytoene dehydrogenase-like protein